MQPGRLIIDPPQSGSRNMAVDQALLETANDTGLVTLRLYEWASPTLSLGYFQDYASRELHLPSIDCDLVRRGSGGGAIMHHHELTYSLAVPSQNRWSKRNSQLYEIVHRQIIELLFQNGIDSGLYRDQRKPVGETVEQNDKHFLCFLRRSDGDIVMGDHKICGSAQRRGKNSLIQHGSLIFEQSEFAPEIRGIHNLADVRLDSGLFLKNFGDLLGQQLRIKFEPGQLSAGEANSAERWQADRFANSSWNQKR